jgi:predicted enzyme related to lactoylglutathione lyase
MEAMMNNSINWFEIPVNDMDRAVRCYETLLDTKLKREVFFGTPHGIFSSSTEGVGGALIHDKKRPPTAGGVTVYLNANGKLDAVLSRAESAKAKVLVPKTAIGDFGFIAIIVDSEGNHIGLHSM